MTAARRRRFWSDASAQATEAGGFAVRLDNKRLRTPGKRELVLPSETLAEAIAREWRAVEAEIDPWRMPLTRAANSAIDGVAPDPRPVVDAIAAYGETDLLCYRAGEPEGLRQRQSALWDPWVAWSARTLGAPLIAVTGVMPHPQPTPSAMALRRAVAGYDAFSLTGLHELVALSGSLVLGLAAARGELDADAAWDLSRLDEIWQAEQWGVDSEAEADAARRLEAFRQAALLLRLLRG
jgi:chaperone required for assembly of F1-ATPase